MKLIISKIKTFYIHVLEMDSSKKLKKIFFFFFGYHNTVKYTLYSSLAPPVQFIVQLFIQ